jgi:uncharacterized protein (DUF1697 family)
MTVMVALLRGINVGGKTSLPMAELRAAVEGAGFDDVRTYIQSGNVVFRSSQRSTAAVEKTLTKAIAAVGKVAPDVMVRTRTELQAVVAGSPFLRRGEDEAKLHVVFLGGSAKATVDGSDLDQFLPEEAIAVGREVHLFLPGGVGRSKLAEALTKAQRKAGPSGTMRSWRTVTKLLALADELA